MSPSLHDLPNRIEIKLTSTTYLVVPKNSLKIHYGYLTIPCDLLPDNYQQDIVLKLSFDGCNFTKNDVLELLKGKRIVNPAAKAKNLHASYLYFKPLATYPTQTRQTTGVIEFVGGKKQTARKLKRQDALAF